MNTIKEYRQSMGLTQKQFSEAFDPPIPIDTIKKWDSGKMNPPKWAEKLIVEKLKKMEGGNNMEKMTVDQLFGIESEKEYFEKTTEEQRITEAAEYISGILVGENFEEGWSVEKHIEGLLNEGLFSEDGARMLKKYMDGFRDGYQKALNKNSK